MIAVRISAALLAVLLTFVAAGAPSKAQSQNWPTRTVKFIVPFGPGAAADIGARLFAEKLSQRWGQPVVIDNRPGGDSFIAITAFLGTDDDHTFLYMPSGNFTVHPFVHSKLPYDPKDLVPVSRASNTILALALAKSSPYTNVREFTEAARAARHDAHRRRRTRRPGAGRCTADHPVPRACLRRGRVPRPGEAGGRARRLVRGRGVWRATSGCGWWGVWLVCGVAVIGSICSP